MKLLGQLTEILLTPKSNETTVPSINSVYLALAIVILGLGVNVNQGNFSVLAMFCLIVSILAAIMALLRENNSLPRTIEGFRLEWAMIFACAVFQFIMVILYPFGSKMHIETTLPLYLFMTIILILALLLLLVMSKQGNMAKNWPFLLLIFIQMLIGIFLITTLSKPGIDVLRFQEGAISALLDGINPYDIYYPDLYPPAASTLFYAPGLSVKGVLQFGYPYLPLTFLSSLPGALLGDVRYASLIAMILSGILITFARLGRLSKVAAVFLLFTPIFPLMLYCGWTDVYPVLMLALVWFCHNRSRRFLPYAVGLLLVSKQYMVLIAPLTILLLPHPWSLRNIISFAWRAILTGMVITLPLALWNIHAFLKSAIFLQFYQPFRWDAMSFLVLAKPHNPSNWVWMPFALVFITIIGLIWVGKRKTINFPLAMGITMLIFFTFSKQAFANYYYLVVGTLCCALADENLGKFKSDTPLEHSSHKQLLPELKDPKEVIEIKTMISKIEVGNIKP
jgi:hypothetical protein